MAARETTTVVIGDWSTVVAKERIRHSSKGGSSHVTMTIRSEPIAAHLDPKSLGRAFALAMRIGLQNQIGSITATAAPATIKRREAAKEALAKGKRWALRNYSGGKMGLRAPGSASSDRLFNDSGRLAEGLTISAIEGGWIINFPSNRMNPRDFAMTHYDRMINRFRELVPGLRDPATLVNAIIEQMPTSTQIAVKARGEGKNNPVRRVTLFNKLGQSPGTVERELGELAGQGDQAMDDLLDKLEQTAGYFGDAAEDQQERGAEEER